MRTVTLHGLAALLVSASMKLLVACGFVGLCDAAMGQSEPWQLEYVHAPRQFTEMRDRSLRFDPDGHPHLIYGKDGLYHAWSDGSSWFHETVDESPFVGTYAALSIDNGGGLHVSYYDEANQALKYAFGESQVWHTEIVDETDWAGAYSYSSIGVDDEGRVHISYHGGSGETLKYAVKEQAVWTLTVLDNLGTAGPHTSLCLDSAGYPHIAYFGWGNLKYAVQHSSGWHLGVVDSEGYVGQYASLCLDVADHPHISYYNATDYQLRYAYHDGTVWYLERADSDLGSGKYTSIALDSSGNPHISHCREWLGDGGLKYTFKDGDGWHSELLDPGDKVGRFSSIVLDGNDSPWISYRDIDNYELKYAGKSGVDWEIHVVDQGGVAGRHVSLALDSARKPHASYEWSPYEYQVSGRLIYGWMDQMGWQREEVSLGGKYTSIVLDTNENPNISHGHNYVPESPPYYGGYLNYAHNDGSSWMNDVLNGMTSCLRTSLELNDDSSPHIAYVLNYSDEYISASTLYYAFQDEAGWFWQYLEDTEGGLGGPSLALDAEGAPHVIYSSYGEMKRAALGSTGWEVDVIDESAGGNTSLCIDAGGCFHLSYTSDSALKYAVGDTTEWYVEVVDESTDVSYATSLSLDGFGQPHIAYYDDENDNLMYAFKDSNGWHTALVDSSGRVGRYLSLAIDENGERHILYFDETRGDLKYAHRPGPIQVVLTADVIGNDLQLSWTSVLSADSYWVYGASDYSYFPPGSAPGYEYRIDVVPQGTTVWISPYPVGDPAENWTYLVSAVDESETELAQSNRVGEFDQDLDIPD
jgi:hypothetical protein